MSSHEDLQSLVDFAVTTAQSTSEIALKYFRSDLQVENKRAEGKFDPVTLADKEIEASIRASIMEHYSDHGIVGEEEGIKEGDSDYRWYIDPIDGTRGFVAGSPMWGTLLGLMKGEDCVTGLMHQPFVGETFVGSKLGAYLVTGNEKTKIHTSSTDNISDSILCCTHLSMFHSGKALDKFIRLADGCRFSRFGTDCYGYAMLALGSVDLIVESNMKAFDIMPLIPLVEAAGGVVTNWQGADVSLGGDVVAAANQELHAQALKLLTG